MWKYTIVTLFVCLSFYCYEIDGYIKTNSFINRNRYSNNLKLNDIITPVVSNIDTIINPSTNEFMTQTIDQGINTFITSFTSRTIGTIIGNVLAGIAFKSILDFFFNKNNDQTTKDNDINTNFKEIKNDNQILINKIKTINITLDAWIKLFFCVSIDVISDSSFFIPGIGELEDIAWAPISAFVMKNIFQSDIVGNIEFIKEILPFTDIIPLATTLWIFENLLPSNPINNILGIKSKIKDIENNK